MANLNLTHSGNMNINSASINSQGQIEVDYAPNTTGKVTGWTTNPEGIDGRYEPGESLTIRFTPQFSGTVLTETFTVSGVDVAGVQRSDSATLRQDYNKDLRTYNVYASDGQSIVNSSSVTENYAEFNITMPSATAQTYVNLFVGVNGEASKHWGAYVVPPTPGPDTGTTTASTLNIVVADSITGTGRASATYTPSNAVVSLRYSSNSPAYATIDPITGEITVLQTGDVRFTVTDEITGLFDSKVVHCYKDGDEPIDTGTVIDSLSIVVGAQIIGSGYVSAIYTPENAEVDLHYTSNLPAVASVDETTGLVTVHSTGNVTFCVRDTKSGLSDCRAVNVLTPEPGIIPATALTINVADTITDSGVATATYEPANADVSLYYSYEDTDIIGANRAGIDRYTGQISVRSTGTARFCVEDQQTGLKACKVVNVVKSETPTPPLPDDTGWTTPVCETRLVVRYYVPENGISNEPGVYYQTVLGTIDETGGDGRPNSSLKFERCELPDGRVVSSVDTQDNGVYFINPTTCVFSTPGYHTLCFVLSTKEIQNWAFAPYSAGIYGGPFTKIYIPDGVEKVGSQAFSGYLNEADEIRLPMSLKSIGPGAFIPSTNYPSNPGPLVEEIVLSPYLESLGNAFNRISDLYIYADTPPILYNALDGTYVESFYYPAGSDYSSWIEKFKIVNPEIETGNTNNNTIYLNLDVPSSITDSYSVTVTPYPNNSVSLTYSTSDPTIATIDNNGNITVLQTGEVVITALDTVSNICTSKRVYAKKTLATEYFTIEALANGSITVYKGNKETLQYSRNNGNWETIYNSNNGYQTISLTRGDKVRMKGTISNLPSPRFSGTTRFNVYGNISTLNYDGFYNAELPGNATYFALFMNCTGLVDASGLVLPYSALTYNCYGSMFQGCTNLVAAPELPATVLADRCYRLMFQGCVSLTTAPALPVTTLANYCYANMFDGCTSLTTAPELPATTLADGCYSGMFANCSSLNYIKCLATTNNGTTQWVQGVASSGTFVKNPSMSSWTTGVNGIPSGWTVEDAT